MSLSQMLGQSNPNVISEYLKYTNLTGKKYEVKIKLRSPTKINADYLDANKSGDATGTEYYENANLPKAIR